MTTMRLAVARFWFEGNAFSPVPTTLASFREREWSSGRAALEAARGTESELAAVAQFADAHPEWEVTVLRCCSANPGGPIDDDAFAAIRDEIAEGARRAALGRGLPVAARRGDHAQRAGRRISRWCEPSPPCTRCPIGASFDLHANLDPAIGAYLSAASGYRTYPHVDMKATAARVLDQLLRVVVGGDDADAWSCVRCGCCCPASTCARRRGRWRTCSPRRAHAKAGGCWTSRSSADFPTPTRRRPARRSWPSPMATVRWPMRRPARSLRVLRLARGRLRAAVLVGRRGTAARAGRAPGARRHHRSRRQSALGRRGGHAGPAARAARGARGRANRLRLLRRRERGGAGARGGDRRDDRRHAGRQAQRGVRRRRERRRARRARRSRTFRQPGTDGARARGRPRRQRGAGRRRRAGDRHVAHRCGERSGVLRRARHRSRGGAPAVRQGEEPLPRRVRAAVQRDRRRRLCRTGEREPPHACRSGM